MSRYRRNRPERRSEPVPQVGDLKVDSVLRSGRQRGGSGARAEYVPPPPENVSEPQWQQLKEALGSKFTVLEQVEEDYDAGTGKRETLVVQGSLGKTKFERVQRHRVPEDPNTMPFVQAYDWVYDAQGITSFVRVSRWDEERGDWREVPFTEVFGR